MPRSPVLAVLALVAVQVCADEFGLAPVIDGDTIEIHGEHIRLHGIDAAKSNQNCVDRDGDTYRCGRHTALTLDASIGKQLVTCVEPDRDQYGRRAARCTAAKPAQNPPFSVREVPPETTGVFRRLVEK